MKRASTVRYAAVAAAVLLIGAALAFFALGLSTLRADRQLALSSSLSAEAAFASVLSEVAREDGVNYQRLDELKTSLHAYVLWLESHGPRSTPAAFADTPSKLAFYINAYNGLVLFAVNANWPISSVHDVRSVFEPKAGFGFFWAQHFVVDGERINLYDLEHDIIRSFGDARIHAAINCASRSCPALQPLVFSAEKLEAQLDDAAREFVNDKRHVELRDGKLRASKIFSWFREDFEADALSRGFQHSSGGPLWLAWVAHFRDTKDDVSKVPIVYRDYDWAINITSK